MATTDPMDAYWERDEARYNELGKIALENNLVLPKSDAQPEETDAVLEEVEEIDEDDNGELSEEEIDSAVEALTKKKKGNQDADAESESD